MAPLGVVLLVSAALFSGSMATKEVNPPLSDVLGFAAIGTAVGGGISAVPAIAGAGASVATYSVVGGTVGATTGLLVTKNKQRKVYK